VRCTKLGCDDDVTVVDTIGSLSDTTDFCRTSDVLGGSGNWAGVRRPKFGGKGGGFGVDVVVLGVGTSGIGESWVFARGGGVTKLGT
jgi:hypothetical protein